jgi:fructose-bisphosphate aldolase/2-amino-3,7-dideoxy-D-threo-hept-6-ulosonate synthase
MVSGKQVRLSRLLRRGRMLCVPVDHGVSVGPIRGLERLNELARELERGGATSLLAHKGVLRSLERPPRLGLILHISASTALSSSPNWKVKVSGVEEAIRLGADALSVHVNIGSKEEPQMLEDLGRVADECDAWGLPLVAMMYPRGENIKNPHDPEVVAHVARVGAELGADIVKTVYTGDPESFARVVRGCPVPVVVAGGPRAESDSQVLEMAHGAMKAGAIGVAFGRNVFQHDRPEAMVRALAEIIFRGSSPERALEHHIRKA